MSTKKPEVKKEIKSNVLDFLKNLIGNIDNKGAFQHSVKKVFFVLTGILTLLLPVLLWAMQSVTGQALLDYYKVVFPSAGVIYAVGKKVDKL